MRTTVAGLGFLVLSVVATVSVGSAFDWVPTDEEMAKYRIELACPGMTATAFIVDLLFDLLGIVHVRLVGKVGQVGAAADLFSCRDNSLDLAADRWNRLGGRDQAQHRGGYRLRPPRQPPLPRRSLARLSLAVPTAR